MKYIFDFDDVIFNNTTHFKEHIYECLEKAGVPRKIAEKYYGDVRSKTFSLKKFITNLLQHKEVSVSEKVSMESLYEEIMRESPGFVNPEFVNTIKGIGKENCYIVTNGDEEFQRAKIERSGIADLFLESNIFVTSGSKGEYVARICEANKSEEVVYIDDKPSFFEDLDKERTKNLTTIPYRKTDFKRLIETRVRLRSELKKPR